MRPARGAQPVLRKVSGFRLDWHDDPLTPRRYPTGKFRFDAPAGEFAVLYACSDELGCFAEVFGDTELIEKQDGKRQVFGLEAWRLRLLDLTDGGCLRSFDLDTRICVERPYARTQRWSRAFFDWYPDLQGLRYTPRHASGHVNYCLYLDRCQGKLAASPRGTIESDLDRLERAVDEYFLATPLLL